MNFLNPLFFLGALAAAVPILLHLVKRERARKVAFPTLMFLRKITKRTIRYQQLRHLLLLLLRILALLCIVLAFMRPYRESSGASPEIGRVTTAHIILLDQSMSMGYGDRWTQAKEETTEIIRNGAEGDMFALLGFSDRTVARTELTLDPSEALYQLEHILEPTDQPTRFAQALKSAEQIALEAGTQKRIIHLISDFQRNGWTAEERALRLSAGIDLDPIDVGSGEYSNLAFRDIHIFEAGRDGGRGMKIQCSVIHYGNGESKKSQVRFSLDDSIVETLPVDLVAGETRAVEFPIPDLSAGSHSVLLEIEDPQLVRDNRFYLTVESGRKIPVLTVESPAARGQRPSSYFLEKALNIDTLSPFQMKRASPDSLDLSEELVIWNNAPAGSPALQEKLRRFVEDGGGLTVVVADSSQSDDFNRGFGSWLPLKMTAGDSEGRRSGSRPVEDYVLMTDVQMDHPIFQPFSQPHSGAFSGARFFRYARFSVDTGVDVPARFDNGDPALVAVQAGRGRVLVFASSADDAGNDLPLKAVYAPLWQQMLRYVGNHQEKRLWLEVGDVLNPARYLQESLSGPAEEPLDSGEAIAVLGPDSTRLQMAPGADHLLLGMSGFYEVRSMNRNGTIAVNTVPKESDLHPGDAEEMTAGWISADSAVAVPDTLPQSEDLGRRQRFWVLLLIAVLLLLAAELFLANIRMDTGVRSPV